MEERSLDEFMDDSSDRKPVEESEESTQTDDESQETIEPATSTAYVFPEGAGCDTCEATVIRLWPADGNRVCGSCKEW